jgi:Type IV secretion system pilin
MKKKILNTMKQAAVIFALMTLGLTAYANYVAVADQVSIVTPSEYLQIVGEGTGQQSFKTGQHPDAPPDYAQPGVGTATSPIYFAIDMFRYVVSGLALLVIVAQAIKLVSTANDEEAGKAKTTLIVGTMGLLIIQVADAAVKKMFFGELGDAFEDVGTTELYAEETTKYLRGIIGLVEVFVGVSAVLIIVIRGILVITSVGDEEAITKAKKHIIYALVGIATVILSEVVVRGVVFPDGGKELPDVQAGRFILINIINYLSGFVAILAFVGLFYGGYRYVMGAGDEEMNEKIKKLIIGALIALLLSLGAFALVNTVLDIPDTPEDELGLQE